MNDPDDFDTWEKLLRRAEGLEGGVGRSSSKDVVSVVQGVYDRFLEKFPLLFGYWNKYAEMIYTVYGAEQAEMVRLTKYCFLIYIYMLILIPDI